MNFPPQSIVDNVKNDYPVGVRVELVYMVDPYSNLVSGDKGTVRMVDDIATVHVNWDRGSSLGVVYGEDVIKRIDE